MSKTTIVINKQTPRQKVVHYDPFGNIRVFSCKALYEAWELMTQNKEFDLDIVGDDVFDEWESIANEYSAQMSASIVLSEPYQQKDSVTLRDDMLVVTHSTLVTLAVKPPPFHLGMLDPARVSATSLVTRIAQELEEPVLLGLRESCGEAYHRNDVNIEYPQESVLPKEYSAIGDKVAIEFLRSVLDMGEVVLSTARPVHWMLAHAVSGTISGIPALYCAPQNYYQQLNRRRGILLHTLIMEGRYHELSFKELRILTGGGQSNVFYFDMVAVFIEGSDVLWMATAHCTRDGDFVTHATKIGFLIIVDQAVPRKEEYVDYCHCAHWVAHLIKRRPMTAGHALVTQNERGEREIQYVKSRLSYSIDWDAVIVNSLIHYSNLLRRHSINSIRRTHVHMIAYTGLQRFLPPEIIRRILAYDRNSELNRRQAMFGMDLPEDDFLTALPNEIVNVHVGRDSISPTGSNHSCARCFLYVPEDSIRPSMVGVHAPGGLCIWKPFAPKTISLDSQPGALFYTRYNGSAIEQMERPFEITRLYSSIDKDGNHEMGS